MPGFGEAIGGLLGRLTGRTPRTKPAAPARTPAPSAPLMPGMGDSLANKQGLARADQANLVAIRGMQRGGMNNTPTDGFMPSTPTPVTSMGQKAMGALPPDKASMAPAAPADPAAESAARMKRMQMLMQGAQGLWR